MSRIRVGIVMDDGGGGDTYFTLCSEEDYNVVINYRPTKTIEYHGEDTEVLDCDAYQEFVGEYFHDEEIGEHNDKVIKWWSTQTYAPENIDLSGYYIICILSMQGG